MFTGIDIDLQDIPDVNQDGNFDYGENASERGESAECERRDYETEGDAREKEEGLNGAKSGLDMVRERYGGNPDEWEMTYKESGEHRFDSERAALVDKDGRSLTDIIEKSGLSEDKIAAHREMLAGWKNGCSEDHLLPEWREKAEGGEKMNITVAHMENDGSISYETWTHFIKDKEPLPDEDVPVEQWFIPEVTQQGADIDNGKPETETLVINMDSELASVSAAAAAETTMGTAAGLINERESSVEQVIAMENTRMEGFAAEVTQDAPEREIAAIKAGLEAKTEPEKATVEGHIEEPARQDTAPVISEKEKQKAVVAEAGAVLTPDISEAVSETVSARIEQVATAEAAPEPVREIAGVIDFAQQPRIESVPAREVGTPVGVKQETYAVHEANVVQETAVVEKNVAETGAEKTVSKKEIFAETPAAQTAAVEKNVVPEIEVRAESAAASEKIEAAVPAETVCEIAKNQVAEVSAAAEVMREVSKNEAVEVSVPAEVPQVVDKEAVAQVAQAERVIESVAAEPAAIAEETITERSAEIAVQVAGKTEALAVESGGVEIETPAVKNDIERASESEQTPAEQSAALKNEPVAETMVPEAEIKTAPAEAEKETPVAAEKSAMPMEAVLKTESVREAKTEEVIVPEAGETKVNNEIRADIKIEKPAEEKIIPAAEKTAEAVIAKEKPAANDEVVKDAYEQIVVELPHEKNATAEIYAPLSGHEIVMRSLGIKIEPKPFVDGVESGRSFGNAGTIGKQTQAQNDNFPQAARGIPKKLNGITIKMAA